MTTPSELGLVTPTGQDWTRDGDNAITTNAQVVAEVYDELKALDTWRGAVPNGTNLDHMAGRTWRGDWGVGEDSTGTQISSLVNLPEVIQGVLSVKTTNTGFSVQIYEPYNRPYFYRRAAKSIKSNPAETTWLPWDKFSAISESGGGSYVKNRILEQEMRRFYGIPELGNAVPVTVIFDHGTNVFKSDILPALTANNLQATLALNSDMYNPSDPRYAHNTNTTWAEIDAWPVEKSNHGRTHGNQTTFADLEYEIVGGLEELQANLPNSKIYTWTQTGQGAGAWMGFENGATADSWDESPAGRLILDNHAVSTGAVMTGKPALYDMNGQVKQGVWGYWLDTPAGIATAKTRIGEAIAQRKGIVLRCHPEVLGNTGNSTAAEVVEFLQWLGAEQTAGRVKSLTFGQWSIANIDQSYTVKETAGRTVTVWDYLNNREQIIYGDTGIRDITALAPNITSGKLYLYRDGNTVTLIFDVVQMAGATGSNYDMVPAGGIPTGFRPPRTFWFNGIDGPPGVRRIGVNSSGWVPVYLSPVPGDVYRGTITWRTTQPWPTVLPGVAA